MSLVIFEIRLHLHIVNAYSYIYRNMCVPKKGTKQTKRNYLVQGPFHHVHNYLISHHILLKIFFRSCIRKSSISLYIFRYIVIDMFTSKVQIITLRTLLSTDQDSVIKKSYTIITIYHWGSHYSDIVSTSSWTGPHALLEFSSIFATPSFCHILCLWLIPTPLRTNVQWRQIIIYGFLNTVVPIPYPYTITRSTRTTRCISALFE